MEGPPIRRSYAHEETLFARVLSLLGIVFPFVPDQVEAARRLGLRWDQVSTPFVVTDEETGTVHAHVGVLELPLVIEGEPVRAAGVHAVATDPARRRQGLYRRTMEAVLLYVDERFPLAILSTDRPVLYEPFGFRAVVEHRFKGTAPRIGARMPSRRLTYDDTDDIAILDALLEERAPVSTRFGLMGEKAVWQFNQAKAPPLYVRDLDIALVHEVEDGTLKLYDVLAREMPDLATVVACVPEDVERVEVYFEPSALGADLVPEPHLLDGDDHLCVRGPMACGATPFLWPSPSRC